VEVRFVALGGDGEVATAATFAPHIDARTRAISLSHVSFHAGQRHQIADIGALCRQRGLYLVVDAMQSVGVLPVDVKQLGVSLLAAGCHKGLLVSQGMGFLYVDRGLQDLQPAFLAMAGMAHPPADYIATPHDMALRPAAGRFEMGNHNLPNLHGLSASLALITQAGVHHIEQHVLDLGDRLLQGLDALGVAVIGPRRREHRAHIYVLDLPVDAWVQYLAAQEVRVSPERGGVRISFALFNNAADVDRVLALIARGLEQGLR
jgi:selenocysteine lyase/cysteine desulfurase